MERQPQPEVERTERLRWKPWAIGIAAFALAILVAQNSQEVEVNFFFAETQAPLVFALLIAGALGGLIGWLGTRVRRRERGRE